MKKIIPSFLALLLVCQVPAQQEDPGTGENKATDELTQKKRWEAHLPSGHYAIPLGQIISISKHRYLLDSSVIVDEVTIDSAGNSLVRFYHMEPVTKGSPSDTARRLTNRGQELLNKAGRATSGQALHEMAQKNYPQSTHAHTIEFRLLSAGELTALYNSLYTAWDTGKGRTFRLTQGEN